MRYWDSCSIVKCLLRPLFCLRPVLENYDTLRAYMLYYNHVILHDTELAHASGQTEEVCFP